MYRLQIIPINKTAIDSIHSNFVKFFPSQANALIPGVKLMCLINDDSSTTLSPIRDERIDEQTQIY